MFYLKLNIMEKSLKLFYVVGWWGCDRKEPICRNVKSTNRLKSTTHLGNHCLLYEYKTRVKDSS